MTNETGNGFDLFNNVGIVSGTEGSSNFAEFNENVGLAPRAEGPPGATLYDYIVQPIGMLVETDGFNPDNGRGIVPITAPARQLPINRVVNINTPRALGAVVNLGRLSDIETARKLASSQTDPAGLAPWYSARPVSPQPATRWLSVSVANPPINIGRVSEVETPRPLSVVVQPVVQPIGRATDTETPRSLKLLTGYEQAVYAAGPLGYWKLDDLDLVMRDSSGNSRDGVTDAGVTTGSPALLPGTPNTKSWLLDTFEGGVVPYDAAWMKPTSFTAEAWVYFTSWGSQASVIMARSNVGGSNTSANKTWQLAALPDGRLTARVYNTGGSTAAPATAVGAIALNTLYYVTLVHDNTNVLLYVNGSQLATAPLTGNTSATSAKPITVGRSELASIYPFNGRIGQAAFYGYALSPTEIVKHYNLGSNPPGGSAAALPIGRVSETETPRPLTYTAATTVPLGRIVETDTASHPVAYNHIWRGIGSQVEADQPRTLTLVRGETRVPISRITEVDTTRQLSSSNALATPLARITETEQPRPLVVQAGPVAASIGRPFEVDVQRGPLGTVLRLQMMATEPDTPLPLVVVRGPVSRTLSQPAETDTVATGLTPLLQTWIALSRTGETDEPRKLGLAKPLGRTSETDTTRPLGLRAVYARDLARLAEVETTSLITAYSHFHQDFGRMSEADVTLHLGLRLGIHDLLEHDDIGTLGLSMKMVRRRILINGRIRLVELVGVWDGQRLRLARESEWDGVRERELETEVIDEYFGTGGIKPPVPIG